MTGRVKCIKPNGFGFVTADDGGPDIFFHASNCTTRIENLQEGDVVEFTVELGHRCGRERAIGVQRI